jgi:hypothetical protein
MRAKTLPLQFLCVHIMCEKFRSDIKRRTMMKSREYKLKPSPAAGREITMV